MKYSISQGYKIFGLELGNELSSAITATQHASHFETLAALLDELYEDDESRPLVCGPFY